MIFLFCNKEAERCSYFVYSLVNANSQQSIIRIEESFIQVKFRTIVLETQIEEAPELCSTRLQNEGGLCMQKSQSYISCLSRIRIGAGKK